MPARSQVGPPGNGFVANRDRPSNPFTPTSEPDWVKVDRPTPSPRPSPQPDRAPRDGATSRTVSQSNPQPRNLPPPFASSSRNPSMESTNGGSPPPRQSSISSTTGRQTLRKPAPPVPSKPGILRTDSNISSSSSRGVNTPSSVAANSVPFPPPPRRAGASGQLPALPVRPAAKSEGERNPPLPPRRGTGMENLMDEDEKEMKGWEPLKPG